MQNMFEQDEQVFVAILLQPAKWHAIFMMIFSLKI